MDTVSGVIDCCQVQRLEVCSLLRRLILIQSENGSRNVTGSIAVLECLDCYWIGYLDVGVPCCTIRCLRWVYGAFDLANSAYLVFVLSIQKPADSSRDVIVIDADVLELQRVVVFFGEDKGAAYEFVDVFWDVVCFDSPFGRVD